MTTLAQPGYSNTFTATGATSLSVSVFGSNASVAVATIALTGTSPSLTASAGWTQVGVTTSTTGISLATFYYVFNSLSNSTALNLSWSGSRDCAVVVNEYCGVAIVGTLDTAPTRVNTSTGSHPQVLSLGNSTNPGTLWVGSVANGSAGIATSWDAGFTAAGTAAVGSAGASQGWLSTSAVTSITSGAVLSAAGSCVAQCLALKTRPGQARKGHFSSAYVGFNSPTLGLANIDAGDIIVASCAVGSSANEAIVGPAGYTAIQSSAVNGAVNSAYYWKVATGGETGVTFSWTNVNDAIVAAAVYRDASPQSIDSAVSSAASGNSGTLVVTGGSTAGNGKLVYVAHTATGPVIGSLSGLSDSFGIIDFATVNASAALVTLESYATSARLAQPGYDAPSTVAWFDVVSALHGASPTNTVAPSVSGTTTVGSTLGSSAGTWTTDLNGALAFTYQWQRDVFGNSVYSNIVGATGATRTLVDADDGCHLRLVVTASDGLGGVTSATSGATSSIVEPAPANSVAPVISGTPNVGQTLSSTTGTWTGMGGHTAVFTRQWQSSPSATFASGIVSLGTATTQALTSTQSGLYIRALISAQNDTSTVSKASNIVGPVAQVPANTVAPVVTGTTVVGQTLTCAVGTWTGSPTLFTFQWQRDVLGNGVFSDRVGSTDNFYVLTDADDGTHLRCNVTGSNVAGSATATSNVAGGTISVVTDASSTWSDNAGVGTLAWTNPGNASTSNDVWASAAAAGSTVTTHYLLGTAFGFAIPTTATINGIQVNVERHQGGGSSGVTDSTVKLVKGGVVSGTNQAVAGVWGNTTDAVRTYGAANDLWGLTLTPSDVNAANFGFAFSVSCASGISDASAFVDQVTISVTYSTVGVLVTEPLPVNSTLPGISGTPAVGQVLSATNGTWQNMGGISTSYTYQWQRTLALAVPGAFSNIAAATSATYTLVSADKACLVVCQVTAHNTGGTAAATSGSLRGVYVGTLVDIYPGAPLQLLAAPLGSLSAAAIPVPSPALTVTPIVPNTLTLTDAHNG